MSNIKASWMAHTCWQNGIYDETLLVLYYPGPVKKDTNLICPG